MPRFPLLLADDIRTMRAQMGLSRTELARLLHYSRLTIRDWELDRVSIPDDAILPFLDLYMKRYPITPISSKISLRYPLAS